MKLNKYITNAFVAVAAIAGFSSCSSDDYERAAVPDNAQVYFSNELSSEIMLEENQTSLQIEIRRINTEGELTVNIEATENTETPVSTVPSSVTFADGDTIAYIPVTFDFDEITSYSDYELTLKLLNDTTPYGDAEKTLSIKYETWTAIYQGDYTYTLFFGSEKEPAVDKGLTMYQCNEKPTKFKIEHWGSDVDFTFTMDDDGSIMVDDQETGYEYGSYGMVMVDDLVDYTGGTSNGQSYYDNGTFNFAIIYYVSAGYFGYGTETFTVTAQATQAANKALAAAKVNAKAGEVEMHKGNLKVSKSLK